MTQKKYNDALLVEEYRICRRCRLVAEKYGCSDETVRRALIKYNEPRIIRHPRKETRPRATKEELKIIIDEYYSSDADINSLVKKYHRSPATISRAIKELGHGIKKNPINSLKITDEQLIKECQHLTLNEIAEKYGMHPYSIPRRCKRLGVYPVGYGAGLKSTEAANKYWKEHPNEQRGCMPSKTFGDCWHFVETQWRKFEALHPGFEYLETKKAGSSIRVRLKCKKCGTIIERAGSTLREKQIRCEQCKADRKLNEARQSVTHVINTIAVSLTPRICAGCGEIFTSPYQSQLYCSAKCKNRTKRKKYGHSYRSRCRKYGVYYDPTVTKEKVIERDNGICQICGKVCDPFDLRWGIYGPDNPTVDHIIALKNGGTHTWDNVQCACRECNSYKRDLTEERKLEWLGLGKL